jgi:hypothetical protein
MKNKCRKLYICALGVVVPLRFFLINFFSKGIMVEGTVLRGVAVVEKKDEILVFDPW